MQEALMEMTKLPLFLRKYCALMPTIRAWSGCATSAAQAHRVSHSSGGCSNLLRDCSQTATRTLKIAKSSTARCTCHPPASLQHHWTQWWWPERQSGTCEDDIHHGHEHAVLLWVARILDDGDHIRPLLGHVDQVTPCRPTQLGSNPAS